MEILKFEYLDNEKSFLHDIKSIFHNFLKAIIWKKKKNSGHKLDISFLLSNFLNLSVIFFVVILKENESFLHTFFIGI